MDNLCHTLVGAAMGEAGLKRRTRYGNAALMVAANVPDLDVLVFFSDVAAVSFRRGWTHGVPAQLLLPGLVTAGFWLLDRARTRRGGAQGPPFHAGWVLALSYLGVYSHVLLDLLNNYGVRLLAPFDWRWFYGDAVFIIDPWLWLTLGLGVWLARRQRRPSRAGVALVVASCYIAAMVISARMARATVAELWREMQGMPPRALMVGPAPLTPFTRVVVIDAGDEYRTGVFRWPRELAFDDRPVPKNEHRQEVREARETSRNVQEFLVWARFPFWRIEQSGDGTRVTVADMRIPEAMGMSGASFMGTAVLRR